VDANVNEMDCLLKQLVWYTGALTNASKEEAVFQILIKERRCVAFASLMVIIISFDRFYWITMRKPHAVAFNGLLGRNER